MLIMTSTRAQNAKKRKARGINKPFDASAKEAFLHNLRHCGEVSQACGLIGFDPETAYAHARKDPDFRQALAEAYAEFRAEIFATAKELAIIGEREDVYDKAGNVIGQKTKRSVPLVRDLLKRHFPEFKDSLKVETHVQGSVSHEHSVDPSDLSPKQAALVRQLLAEAPEAPAAELSGQDPSHPSQVEPKRLQGRTDDGAE